MTASRRAYAIGPLCTGSAEVWLWRLAAVMMLGVASCDDRAPQPEDSETFSIEVIGPRAVLERFRLQAEEMTTESELRLEGAWMKRVLHTTVPWERLKGRSFELTASEGDRIVGRLTRVPFLCTGEPVFHQRLADGWNAKERHQVSISAAGELDATTDFTQLLLFSCEWKAPSGGDGDGVGSPFSSSAVCSEPDRAGTVVTMTGIIGGTQIETTPEVCYSALSDRLDGILNVTLTRTMAGKHISFSMGHYLSGPQGSEESYPMSFELPRDVPPRLGVSLAVSDAIGQRYAETSRGWFRIDSAAFARGSRFRGSLDIRFNSSSGDELTVAGTLDLPIVRIPSEFDWRDP